jgi:hypothetical protein
MNTLLCALALAGSLAVQDAPKPQATPTPAPPAAKAEDVKSVDAIIGALYDVISGPAGQKRDWDRMRSLFVPGARLIPAVANQSGGATARVLEVQGYIDRSGPTLEKNGFFEREVARKTDAFGNIMHLFSTYESRHTAADPAPFARGINSIDLLKDGDRWWIVTVYWDSERPGNPIPTQYLPGK